MTPRRRSRSRRASPGRRSSARRLHGRTRGARARRRTRPPRSRRARTRSSCVRSTPQAASTPRPRAARSPSTRSRRTPRSRRPHRPDREHHATFTYTSEAGATFQCALDGAAFAACPASYTGLAQGAHTFQVRAVDAAGNVDASPASRTGRSTRSRRIRRSAPARPGARRAPARPSRSPRTTPAPRSMRARRRRVRGLPGRATPACRQGAHTFQVRAVDAAGNVDASPASRTWTVDTTAPNAPTIENAAAGGSTVTLSGKSEAGATVEILEGAAVVGSTTADSSANWTLALANVPDGSHTLRRTGPGRGGQRRAAPRRRAPSSSTRPRRPRPRCRARAERRPTRIPRSRSPPRSRRWNAGWTGPAGAGSYAACVSPKSFSALAPGDYVFFVRVTDAVGPRRRRRDARSRSRSRQAAPDAHADTDRPRTPTPTPVPNQTIVVTPAKTGTVLVKLKGATTFEPLDVTKGIPNGSEVDVRNGRVTLTSIPKAGAPPETADFYGGMFIVTQKGGITDLKLSETLTGCPKGQQASLSLARRSRSRASCGATARARSARRASTRPPPSAARSGSCRTAARRRSRASRPASSRSTTSSRRRRSW